MDWTVFFRSLEHLFSLSLFFGVYMVAVYSFIFLCVSFIHMEKNSLLVIKFVSCSVRLFCRNRWQRTKHNNNNNKNTRGRRRSCSMWTRMSNQLEIVAPYTCRLYAVYMTIENYYKLKRYGSMQGEWLIVQFYNSPTQILYRMYKFYYNTFWLNAAIKIYCANIEK